MIKLRAKIQADKSVKIIAYIFGSFLMLLAFALLTRKSINLDIMKSVNIDESSAVSGFASVNDGIIHYEAVQADDQVIDFNQNTETFHADIGHLQYGVYMIRAEYKTEYDTSSYNPVCTFTLGGKNNGRFMYDVIKLYQYKSWVESPVWVTSASGADDVRLNINYTGYGYCDISSITIYEYNLWKTGFLMLIFFVFTAVFVSCYKFCHADMETRLTWFFLSLIVLFSSFLCAVGEYRTVGGDDFNFHIGRIASIANEIRYGHIPVWYQSDAIYGYGYISPLVYGSIFLYIPAFMHLLGMPLSVSYNIYIFMVNCATCFTCQYSFKRLFKKNRYAVLGTALYLLSAYRIINIYIRTAVGEYTAMAFLPLVLYGFYRIYFENKKINFKDTLPLIIGMSGIIESHILTVEMSILFIGLFALIHIKRTIKNLMMLLQALFTVIGINLFFIVPFIDAYCQQININSREFSSNIFSSHSGLSQIFGLWIYEDGRVIGFSLVIGILIFLTVCICKKWLRFDKKENDAHKLAVECFLYGLLCVWLSSCYFPWEELAGRKNAVLKVITSIQFSTRYLSFATIFLVISTVYAIKKISEIEFKLKGKNNLFTAMAAGLISVCIIVNGSFYSEMMKSEDLGRILSKVSHISADRLYLPKGMDDNSMPDADIAVSPEYACFVEKRGTTRSNDKIFHVQQTLNECTITLPVVYYDYIIAYDSFTGERLKTEKGFDGRLAVCLEEGYSGEITVSYHVSGMWKASCFVSLLFCAGTAAYIFLKRRESKKPCGKRGM